MSESFFYMKALKMVALEGNNIIEDEVSSKYKEVK
jgi:hypothetical protein